MINNDHAKVFLHSTHILHRDLYFQD
jgi:hypothetical protein